MNRLLVRVPNWLGDLVMSLESLSGLASRHPRITFWAHGRVAGLLPVFFPGVPLIVAPDRPERGEFDSLLLLTDSFRSALDGLLARIPQRMGHSTQMRRPLLSRTLQPLKGRGHHHSLDYARLCRLADAEPAAVPHPSVEPSGSPHVAVFAGAAFGPAKRWGGFAEVSRALSGELGVPAVFYGPPSETGMLSALAAQVPGSVVRTDLDLEGLCSELLSAVEALGNDSGGIHLAAALGVPSVAVFGSTSPEWTAPRGRLTASVASDLECSPCFRRSCSSVPAACLASVKPETVLEACRALLARASESP